MRCHQPLRDTPLRTALQSSNRPTARFPGAVPGPEPAPRAWADGSSAGSSRTATPGGRVASLNLHLSAFGALLDLFFGQPRVPARQNLAAVGVVGKAQPVGACVVRRLLLIDHRRVVALRGALNRACRETVANGALCGLHVFLRIDPR